MVQASLFDATLPLPANALTHIAAEKRSLRERRADLKRRTLHSTTRPATGAASSITGQVLEKIAPSLRGFPVSPGDCRALFNPIDYIIFKGLAARGKVDALIFVDVKSGNASLKGMQLPIRKLVRDKKVTFHITPKAKEAA